MTKPAFIVHANAFLSQGFAVLTYDKGARGFDRQFRNVRL